MAKTTPHKRSTDVENKIIKHIRDGASFSDAPRLEGIDESSFRRRRKCKDDQGSEDITLRDRRCWNSASSALQKQCDEAESIFKQSCIQTIHKAGEKNWRTRAWLLERRYRDEYGVRAIVETNTEEPFYDPSRMLVEAITGGIYKKREAEAERQKDDSLRKEP